MKISKIDVSDALRKAAAESQAIVNQSAEDAEREATKVQAIRLMDQEIPIRPGTEMYEVLERLGLVDWYNEETIRRGLNAKLTASLQLDLDDDIDSVKIW